MIKKPNMKEYTKFKKSTKVYYLTCWYVCLCTDYNLYIGKKLSRDYWRVYKFFSKFDDNKLHYLYQYIATLNEKKILGMLEFYNEADKRSIELKMETKDIPEVKPYEELMEAFKRL